MSKSVSASSSIRKTVYVDTFIEAVYDDSRRYGFAISTEDSVVDINMCSASDTESRHTLQRRATRKALNSLRNFERAIIRSPTGTWIDSGLALGNMRNRSFEVQLRCVQSDVYDFASRLLTHDGASGMTTSLESDLPSEVNLYTDGSGSDDNLKSCGWIITDSESEIIYRIDGCKLHEGSTSTDVELMGLINGFKSISGGSDVRKINVYCDCQYPIRVYRNPDSLDEDFASKVRNCKLINGSRSVNLENICRDDNVADIPARVAHEMSFKLH